MHQTNGRYPWRYGLYMGAYYFCTSIYLSFISVYFKQLQLPTRQISILMAAIPLISIIAQPVWGTLGDRMKNRSLLLRALALASSVMILLFRVSDGFWWLLVMVLLFSSCFTALQPLGDSVILEALQPGRRPFGPLRLVGCVVFAVSSTVVGGFLDGRMNWVIYLTAIALGFIFLATFALPPVAGHQREKQRAGIFLLLKQKELAHLLVFITLLQITMGYFYSFFSVHFVSLPGGTSALLGWCYLISAASEIPFLLLSDKLFDRLGAGKLMCISALALTLRWVTLAISGDIWFVMISQVLHGWGFIVMTVSMAKYISLTVPEELRARGQMLLAIVGFGIARVVGTLGGGLLAEGIGLQKGFYVTATISAIALIAYAPRYLRTVPLNGIER